MKNNNPITREDINNKKNEYSIGDRILDGIVTYIGNDYIAYKSDKGYPKTVSLVKLIQDDRKALLTAEEIIEEEDIDVDEFDEDSDDDDL